MSTSFISPIQLTQTEIIKLSFELLDDKPLEPGANVRVSLAHEFNDSLEQPENDTIAGGCKLGVKFEIEGSSGSAAFTSECMLWGVATIRLPDETSCVEEGLLASAWEALHVNLVSFLYSTARSVFEMVTQHSPIGKQYLPAINPQEYLKTAVPAVAQPDKEEAK